MEKTNQPGMLANVNKNILTVAPEYQRTASPSLIKSIKDSWDWRAAGVLVVSKRDNQHFVIDGQHRLRAAQSIAEIDKLPCIIFDNLSLQEEAAALADINTRRKSMTSIDKFVAKLAAGNPLAVYVNNRVESQKFRIAAKGANTFNCIKQMTICASKNKARFDRVLDVCVKLFKHNQVPRHSFVALEYLDSKISLADEKLRDRILTVGADAIKQSIRMAQMRFDGNHPRVCAIGLLDAVNKNLRNKFEVEL
jgi:hypothetical protein